MDKLEKYIQKHRDAFDNEQPEKGHEERFLEKLQQEQPKARSLPMWKNAVKIAAIVAIFLTAGTIFLVNYPFNSPKAAEQGMRLSEVSPEYQEVETYLQSNLDNKIDEFERLQCPSGDVEKKEVMQEITELDSMYQELQQDLKKNQGNERIINAMINTYRTRIEILEQVINQVETNC